jgi:hypothetical protein
MTTTLTLSLPRPHAGQREVFATARRFNVLACGRRWGKSTSALHLLARPALSGRPVGYFAPTYKLLIEVWRAMRARLAPVLAGSNATERRLELITGGVVEFWTLEDENAGRSRKYARVVIDEAGLVSHLGEVWNAAIRPTLADLAGDAWLMGTPKGRNFFWHAYQRAGSDPDWMAWQRSTGDNPHIPPAEVAAMRAELPERIAAQEIDAAFLEDGGGVFRNVRARSTARHVAGAEPGHAYVIGVDWGRSGDYTVISVIDVTARRQVHLDRFTGLEFAQQRGRLVATWQRFGRPPVWAEQNSFGIPLIESLVRDGVSVQPFVTTNASKAHAVDALALALERADVELLADAVQVAELEAYEAERLPSGLIRYGAPEGSHDDTVMALLIAWQAAAAPPRPVYRSTSEAAW